jgi:hypothetical protein
MEGSNQEITNTGRGWADESLCSKLISTFSIGSPIQEESVENFEAEID